MIGKDKLVFDVTDAGSIAASDSVGAFVRAGTDGELIDSTSNALHVLLQNASVAVTATDLDIRNLVFADDKVDISGSSNVAVTDGGGSLTVDGSVTVSATDLDIRDLNSATDSVTVIQGTSPWVIGDGGSSISIDDNGGSITVDGTVSISGSVTVTATDLDIRNLVFADDKVDVSGSSNVAIVDGGGSITVDASQLDIDDLNATDDAVQAWLRDGAGNSITSSGGALDVNIQSSDIEIDVQDDKANVALENTATSVTTTSAALLGSQLADRRFMWVQNLGNQAIFVGKSGVTTANGLRLSPGSVLEIRLGPAVSMHAVANSGTQDTRIMEAS